MAIRFMVKIKICGITPNDDISRLVELEPDFLGFIFFSKSPRDISDCVHKIKFELISHQIERVAVTVNKPIDEVCKLVDEFGFEYVQLHGDETVGYCKELSSFVKPIKVFRVTNELPGNVSEYQQVCEYILFDAKGFKLGGNGHEFNHSIFSDYHWSKPFLVGGGIGPDFGGLFNLIGLPGFLGLYLNSRFEVRLGLKNIDKLKYFIGKIRSYDKVP
ncbi:MAG TPA: phosphoribosylanthranilate isomerase [Bacteroidales bacterium]|nr:phosphoribosylanthranilate isomerase [Bacteroidales bacterium]